MTFQPKLVPTHKDSIETGRSAVQAAFQRCNAWISGLRDDDDPTDAIIGLIKRLYAADMLSQGHYYDFMTTLEKSNWAHADRPGRDKAFYIEVSAIRGGHERYVEGFNVKATNALDAYVALSKRSEFRFMNDVFLVRVFTGDALDAQSGIPVRTFSKSELIFV